jgi:23S rRNA (uracil1939-C5)-methyltransferase
LRKRKRLFFEKVLISDIGAEGKAIARIDNMVVFVPLVAPGDIVDLEITKKRSRYMEGRVTHFHAFSESRTSPVCKHFGICGGCRWQHIPYHDQLIYKQNQVRDALLRIGKLDIPMINPILGSKHPYFYRNKLEFAFSSRRWLTNEEISSGIKPGTLNGLGFHVPGQFDKVVNIDECWLQPEPSNAIRNELRCFAEKNGFDFFNPRDHGGFLRNLLIRTSNKGEVMVILSLYHDDKEKRGMLLEHLIRKFPQVCSWLYTINSKGNDTLYDQEIHIFSGKDFITEELDGLAFRIGPKSFFQTNTNQAIELLNIIREFSDLNGSEVVYDLYTGTGTIANYMARSARMVIGIESVKEAIADAKKNAEMNHIKNTSFLTGDIKDVLTNDFIDNHGTPDLIITDPPRSGMHRKVIESIHTIASSKIIYVSCNPATQARDLELLSPAYKITRIQPVDMFPQTHHVENVILLERK